MLGSRLWLTTHAGSVQSVLHRSLIGCIALVLLLPACSTTTTGSTSSSAGSSSMLVYGMPVPFAQNAESRATEAGVACYAKKVGAQLKTTDANLDVNKQISDADTLMAEGANALVVIPLDPKALNAVYQRAKQQNVIAIDDGGDPNSAAAGHVSEDSLSYGTAAVQYVQTKFPQGAKAILLGGPPVEALNLRAQGFSDNALSHKITIVAKAASFKATIDDARSITDDLLTKHPDINVIYAISDEIGIGAGLAVQAHNLKNVVIISIGASPDSIAAIKSGVVTASYDSLDFELGQAAARMAADLHAGKKSQPFQFSPKLYDRSIVSQYVPPLERCV